MFRPVTLITRSAPPRRLTVRLLAALAATGLAGSVVLAPALVATAGTLRAPCADARRPPVIATVPWPQQRYDAVAVSRITDGAGVTVAVVDSGVDRRHAQLAGAVVPGADVLASGGSDGRRDCVGHGTAVASVIAARPVGGSGLVGLAPGAAIMPVRANERIVAGGSAGGGVADLAAGIRAATRAGVGVINLSVATGADVPGLRSAVAAAVAADIVVVAAVGSDDQLRGRRPYPAAYPGVMGIGGVDRDGRRIDTSPRGSFVDLVAAADGVVGAAPGRGHGTFRGTSFAAPFVSAAAALVRARWPGLAAPDVVRRLLATADPAPGARPSPSYGWGALNPRRALTEVLPGVPGGDAGGPGDDPGGTGGSSGGTGSVPGAGRASGSDDDGVRPAGRYGSAPAAGPGRLTLAMAGGLVTAAAALAAGATAVGVGRRRRRRA
jgi:type VII secretion-associated serine protease mycosin